MFKFALLLSLFSISVFSAELTPLKVLSVDKTGNKFSFERQEGELPHYGFEITNLKKKKLYEVKVLKCGPKTCLAEIKEKLTVGGISKKKSYLHRYHEAKTAEVVPEKTDDPFAGAPEVPAGPTGDVYTAYLGYGNPVGSGVKAGFYRLVTKKTQAGPNLSFLSDETKSVSIKGSIFSVLFTRQIWKISENWRLNLLGEFGFVRSKLDFSGVSASGPKQEETTYLVSFGSELKYHIDPVAIGARAGFSKNGLKSEYENNNQKFNNPYGKVLGYIEFGIYYTF